VQAITYYRWETLCELVEQGLSVEEIAERLHNTPEQVQSWIAEIPAGFRNRRAR